MHATRARACHRSKEGATLRTGQLASCQCRQRHTSRISRQGRPSCKQSRRSVGGESATSSAARHATPRPVFSLVRSARGRPVRQPPPARAAAPHGTRRRRPPASQPRSQRQRVRREKTGRPDDRVPARGTVARARWRWALTPTGVCAHDTARPYDGGADADAGDDGRADRPGARVRAAPQLLSRHARCLPGPLADDSIGSAFFLLCC